MDYWADTGFAAGKIYMTLESRQDRALGLTELKKQVSDKCFEYALGWLLREEKITIEGDGKRIQIKLK